MARCFALAGLLLLSLAASAHAYNQGTRKKSIETNTVNVYGLDAGLCEVKYNITCSLPCYASVMTINQLQAFGDRLYRSMPGELCDSDGSVAQGAVTSCGDTVELSPKLNCFNFQAYNLVVYFNATEPSGKYMELEYDLEFESSQCPKDECPDASAVTR